MDILETIKKQVSDNAIILYMKGSPERPQCGFSSHAVQALQACGQPFAYVDVLAEPEIRANLSAFSDWPTFPQLFIKGELVGGCDIIMELYEEGELQRLVQATSKA